MNEHKDIPFIAFESMQARFDRIHFRDCVIIVLLLILLFGTNLMWVTYEMQWQRVESTTITQDVDAEDGNATISDGVHINGESKTDSNKD